MTSMVNSLVARMSTDFLIGFSALFSLINPLGMAFVFAEKTRSLPDGARVALAGKVATYSFVPNTRRDVVRRSGPRIFSESAFLR